MGGRRIRGFVDFWIFVLFPEWRNEVGRENFYSFIVDEMFGQVNDMLNELLIWEEGFLKLSLVVYLCFLE